MSLINFDFLPGFLDRFKQKITFFDETFSMTSFNLIICGLHPLYKNKLVHNILKFSLIFLNLYVFIILCYSIKIQYVKRNIVIVTRHFIFIIAILLVNTKIYIMSTKRDEIVRVIKEINDFLMKYESEISENKSLIMNFVKFANVSEFFCVCGFWLTAAMLPLVFFFKIIKSAIEENFPQRHILYDCDIPFSDSDTDFFQYLNTIQSLIFIPLNTSAICGWSCFISTVYLYSFFRLKILCNMFRKVLDGIEYSDHMSFNNRLKIIVQYHQKILK